MGKENQYLAEKIISNIKNYKVIDEIISFKTNNSYVSNDIVKKKEQITKNIQETINKPKMLDFSEEKDKKDIFKNVKNEFDSIFNDNSKNKIIKDLPLSKINSLEKNENISKKNNVDKNKVNNLAIDKKGITMSNINQKYFENNLDTNKNVDSYSLNDNPDHVSMVDLLSEDNLSSIDDLGNIVNINDVYDDLGRNFQDDLINQYNELDKSVSHSPQNLKYSYLPKRKIRDILFDKYNIKNEECVNELYSMAFNNKWKEIDVEHWLLNPTNIDNLVSKCSENDYALPKIKEEKSDVELMPEKKLNENFEHTNNSPIKKEIVENKNNIPCNEKIEPRIIPQNNIIEAKPIFHHSQQQFSNIKDDLKSVLIEENYRKMQFDFQTEILKNHIDSKFRVFNDNQNSNNSFDKYSSNDKKINEDFINLKMDSFFNERKSEILNEINDLKEKFSKNEKTIWESLDFIRKEMKNNQNSLTSSLSNSLQTIKDEIGESLSSYIDEFQKKQSNALNDLLDNFDNKNALAPLKESFDQKLETLSEDIKNLKENFNQKNNDLSNDFLELSSDINQLKQNFNQKNNDLSNDFLELSSDINQLKQNFNQKNNDLSNDFLELRKEINDRVSTISNELSRNIDNLYDEIDDINETLKETNDIHKKSLNESNNLLVSKKENADQILDSDEKKEIEKIIESLDKINENPIINQNLSDEKKPNYLDYLENDKIDFDNISSFHEQDMNYNNVNKIDDNNVDFEYLKSSSDEFEENKIDDFDYDSSQLSKKDRDFYKDFISNNQSEFNNSSKIISNFDSQKNITNLDIETSKEIIIEKKNEFDIKSKLSKIDEIIKNSINELNDIKEIVDDNEVRIDDSIKLFEKVK